MDVQIIEKILQQKSCRAYSLWTVTIWAFDNIENKHTLYCGEDWMKKVCTSLREGSKNIIDLKIKRKCYCQQKKN